MAKNTFIRATEIWKPTGDRKHLDLIGGLYSDMEYFQAISRGMRFAFNEGLPGKTWAFGHPIVLKDLRNSYFMRGDAAVTEGLSCAVSLPIFVAGELNAVIVFFCGSDRFHVGALELWNAVDGQVELGFVDGYFGRARGFEYASLNTRFPRTVGLPGKVWDTGKPVIMDDLGRGDMFLRRNSAEKVGINRAVGLPCTVNCGGDWVLTFLSAKNTPIARRFECWTLDRASNQFQFESGFCESGADLAQTYANTVLPPNAGQFGEALSTNAPVICEDIGGQTGPVAQSAKDAELESMVAMPVYSGGQFKAVLSWFL